MFFPESNVKVWLSLAPTDMRKSYDGLIALAKNHLNEDPLSGHLFVFFNRKRNRVKALYFDRGGYCIWMKRLESGVFRVDSESGNKKALTWTELKLILDGFELKNIAQYKRYHRENYG